MSLKVCLGARCLYYPNGGGHLWVYLNWALGLQSLGCEVVWLEGVDSRTNKEQLIQLVESLKQKLAPYGLDEKVALCTWKGEPFSLNEKHWNLIDSACDADLFLNLVYDLPPEVIKCFKRSVLLDIDPGLLQTWMTQGNISVAPYDLYFTIGETVGTQQALFPDGGFDWIYTPPCVDLKSWPAHETQDDSVFTTVTQWTSDEWVVTNEDWYCNDKRTGFLPFLELPQLTSQTMELALNLGDNDSEQKKLQKLGWRIKDSNKVAATLDDYQQYIQSSRGEFSCVKPSCIRFQNAWISDRTLCYLASGKPAVVQHTGPSRFLPDGNGLFRFHNMAEAVESIERVACDYERQGQSARQLAEEYFSAEKVVRRVLEHAIT